MASFKFEVFCEVRFDAYDIKPINVLEHRDVQTSQILFPRRTLEMWHAKQFVSVHVFSWATCLQIYWKSKPIGLKDAYNHLRPSYTSSGTVDADDVEPPNCVSVTSEVESCTSFQVALKETYGP